MAAKKSIVTVEKVVERLDPVPGGIIIPSWAVTYVAEEPGGARPSYALGFNDRQNESYVEWEAISRDRNQFLRWLDTQGFAQVTLESSISGVS